MKNGFPPSSTSSSQPSNQFPSSDEFSQIHATLHGEDEFEEALSAMLMSWYQSGYATGRFEVIIFNFVFCNS